MEGIDMSTNPDPITVEIFRHQFEGVAEEMGEVLVRGAYSPNIKERQDCSTALFDRSGQMVAQAEHIPVHLGAMPGAIDGVLDRDPQPHDVFVLNDPFEGGTHLPDLTLVSTIVSQGSTVGYAVSRAHHADVGGMSPGSMPAGAREIYQEGLRLPPVRLEANGDLQTDILRLILANVRNSRERNADLRAQLAAHRRGEERIRELIDERGRDRIVEAFDEVIAYSGERFKAEIEALPDGSYTAEEALEGDGVHDEDIPIKVEVTIDGEKLTVDFSGTAPQVPGNLNAPLPVAKSAVYFVLRCVTDPEIPPNEGCYEPVTIAAPEGCLVNPNPPAGVVGGNVETSQRITDAVFSALANAVPDRVPAQGQGTMNNLVIGGTNGKFTYYETIGGGSGAGPDQDGMDGVQVAMTNTLNTPVESLEIEYPMEVVRYALRDGSGGAGRYRGGLGLERTICLQTEATISLLTERRRHAPKGLRGGEPGATGENLLNDEPLDAKTTVDVPPGSTVTVLTPGGGGYGDFELRDEDAIESDRADGKVA